MCAMPSKVKTWSIDPCNRETVASLAEAIGDCYLGIKNALKLMSGVTVKGSCDGTTGAMDGVDRWAATANVQTRFNGSGGAQSWIVLDLANMGGAELLLTNNSASTSGFSWYYSPGGNYAAAGTPNQKPTAADEVTIGASVTQFTNSTTNDRLWSTWVSSDGAALAFGIAEAGNWTAVVFMQAATNRITSGTLQAGVVACYFGSSAGALAFAQWGTARPVCRVNTTNLALKLGSEGYGTALAGSRMPAKPAIAIHRAHIHTAFRFHPPLGWFRCCDDVIRPWRPLTETTLPPTRH